MNSVATVREQAIEVLRAHGMTTIFGNPGSTELPMLADLPDDFRYVLALHEGAAVGMADGYAQASGRPAHANLHTAPGVGNAVGALGTAQANHAPVLVTAGQQVRAQIGFEALLTNRDAILVPQPHVKWAHEPSRAQDVPAALARAIHHVSLPPRGPAFVSVPMDDWDAEADGDLSAATVARRVSGRCAPDEPELARLAARLEAARSPALVVGPEVDAAGGWESAVALAERQRLVVWAAPAPGGSRIGFPERHRCFAGLLPPAIAPLAQALSAHDLVVVAGSAVFPYYPYVPGPPLASGCELVALTSDPSEAARAPMGDAIVGDVATALARLVELTGTAEDRPQPAGRPAPGEPAAAASGAGPAADAGGQLQGGVAPVLEGGRRLSGSQAAAALAAAWPDDAIAVVELPSSVLALRNRLRPDRPGSWYSSASGGLGFGIAAAVGVALAQPSRPVVCVLGDGSAQYGITALWTAVAYRVPVTFVVLRNDEYAILKWFAQMSGATGVPGLDLPGLDVAAVARGYGMTAKEVGGSIEELVAELRTALGAGEGPRLIQVPVAAGMWVQ